jgi:hypothetical protein
MLEKRGGWPITVQGPGGEVRVGGLVALAGRMGGQETQVDVANLAVGARRTNESAEDFTRVLQNAGAPRLLSALPKLDSTYDASEVDFPFCS